jgi:RNase adaptor protein for sRNA GlmZ degradation
MNGKEIKRILKMYYKKADFKVRIKRAGFDRAIDIRTDLLQYTRSVAEKHYDLEWKLRRGEGLRGKEAENYEFYEKLKEQDEQMKKHLKEILRRHGIEEHVRRCPVSGEILLGGNLYIDINPLE